MEFNHYQVLGIGPYATGEEIKKAYKLLAKKYHPDVNPGNQFYEDHFKKINLAYQVLSDSAKRQQYDLKLYYTEHPPAQAVTRNATRQQSGKTNRTPYPPRQSHTLRWDLNLKQSLMALGIVLVLIIGGYTLYRSMNRYASNNLYETGLSYARKNDYSSAMYYYRQGIEMDNTNYKIHINLANTLINTRSEFKESYLEASYLYRFALKHVEEKDSLWYKLSTCYFNLNEYEQTLSALNEISTPVNDTVFILKGESHLYYKRWDKALEAFNNFLSKHPKSDFCLQKTGYIHYRNTDFEKAKENLDQALSINPYNGVSYYIRGLIALEMKDSLNACEDFTNAQNLNYEFADRALYMHCRALQQ